MNGKLSVANLIAGIGGLVAFLFSFFGFWDAGKTVSAWDADVTGYASAVPAILGLAMVVVIVLEVLGVALPEKLLTFDWKQIKATFGISAAGLYLSWIATSPFEADKAAMFWLQVLGGIAMAVGAIMALLGKGSETIGTVGGNRSSGTSTTQSPGPGVPPPPGSSGTAPPPPPPGGSAPPPPPPSS